MKRIYTYLSVKCNLHVHVEINFKHLNTYVQGDICSHTELVFLHLHDFAVQLPLHLHLLQDNEKLACLAAAWREMGVLFSCCVERDESFDPMRTINH